MKKKDGGGGGASFWCGCCLVLWEGWVGGRVVTGSRMRGSDVRGSDVSGSDIINGTHVVFDIINSFMYTTMITKREISYI